jgi:hypothetical protein
MKFRFITFFILFISNFYLPYLYSQNDEASPILPGEKRAVFNIGPVIGFNRSLHSVDLASFAQDPLCPRFTNGNDNGYFFGINTELFFLGQKRTEQSLIFRLLYNTFPSYFEVGTGDLYPSLVNTGSSTEIVNSATTNTLTVKYNVITFEAQYKFNPVLNFGIIVGPTFDFAMKKTLTQNLKLIADPNVQFQIDGTILSDDGSKKKVQTPDGSIVYYTDNDRTIIVHDGDINGSSSFRFGIKAGVQYEFNLPGIGKVVPSANYNFGVTKLSSAENWRTNAFQIGLDIRFQIKRFFGLI